MENIVLISRKFEAQDRDAHLSQQPTRKNITKITSGHSKAYLFIVFGNSEIAFKIINDLR